MNLLTFLGVGKYNPTTYTMDGKTHTTPYAPAAVAHFYKPEKTLVVVTDKAESMHFETLADEIAGVTTPIAVPIPDGKSEDELWQIFNALTKHVTEGDELVVDITYGFRSLPFLSFLAIVFLRLARKVTVRQVLYGAYDARTGNAPTDISPIFDLTSFLTLLDWLTATDRFTQTGNAVALAKQLRTNQALELVDLAETVENIATGLHLLRPKETSAAAAKLPGVIECAQGKLPPPFAILANNIETSYSRFGLSQRMNDREQLGYELEMVNWYHQRGQIVHTLSMAREWVISFLCIHFGLDDTDWQARNEMEFLIGGGKKKGPDGEVLRESPYRAKWSGVPQGKRLRKLWVKGGGFELADLRNDVLHSGFRKNPKPADELKVLVDNAITELNNIADELGFSRAHQEHPEPLQ